MTLAAFAKPPRPGVHHIRQSDGTTVPVYVRGDMHFHYMTDTLGNPVAKRDGKVVAIDPGEIVKRMEENSLTRSQESPRLPGLYPGTYFPSTGKPPVLIILVDTPDRPFTLKDPHWYFNAMSTERGFSYNGSTGSVLDWFSDNSCGVFEPEFHVYGPVTVSNDMAYYGQNDSDGQERHVWEMLVEACELLDEEVDFSIFDNDGDGNVDNVYMYYAGTAESSTDEESDIWPHAWNISSVNREPFYFDGVRINRYACSNEWEFYHAGDGQPDGIGTFIHEFSHVLGLPDLYATSYTSAFTPGSWSVMDTGCYNNDSRTPPLYSSFERSALGWIEPFEIEKPTDVILPDLVENEAAMVTTGSDNEYFLFENRQQVGWDEYLPHHGMLIWHIDYNQADWRNNTVNNKASRQRVDIVEADDKQTKRTITGDPFPGTANVTSFTSETKPSFVTWSGEEVDCPITEIAETKGVISFKAKGGVSSVDVIGRDNVSVQAVGNSIVVSGAQPSAKVEVFSPEGVVLAKGAISNSGDCRLSTEYKGIAIVRIHPNGSFKTLLR